MATVNLGRTRSPAITNRKMFAIAGAIFAIALIVIITGYLMQNVNSLSAKSCQPRRRAFPRPTMKINILLPRN